MDQFIENKRLIEYCSKLLLQVGVPRDEANIIADSLVDANLTGVDSHGVSRMQIYLKRLETGVVAREAQMHILSETDSILAVDGCNSMGMVTGVRVMAKCIEKARLSGIGFATVCHSNHYGTAAYYVRQAARENMIGISMTNAPPNIAPWGSKTPYMGTNPIAFGVPRRDAEPIVLDMAPSVVAMGRVILAAKLDQDIPIGWALDVDGNDTTDPKLGMKGSVVPIGGPKGSGLALIIDILTGLLSGAQFGPYLNNMWSDFENPQDVGHLFTAIDISRFTDLNVFLQRLEVMRQDIKALPKKPGFSEILLPGEIESNSKRRKLEQGIALPEVVYQELLELGRKYNVDTALLS